MKKTKTKSKLKKYNFNFGRRRLTIITGLVVVLVVAAIGGYRVYRSFADSINTNDEKIQYIGINKTRADNNLPLLHPSVCLNKYAEYWAKHMSADGKISHTSNGGNTLSYVCAIPGSQFAWWGENVGAVGPGCTSTSTTDTCSEAVYRGFLGSPGHYANIISKDAVYVGVGAYRNDKTGTLYIAQEYYTCSNCRLSIYTPVTWKLTSSTAASSTSTPTPTSSATVHRGETYSLYSTITNNGPDTATYVKDTTINHYYSDGRLASTQKKEHAWISTDPGQSYQYKFDNYIPSNWLNGEKVCVHNNYSYASGIFTIGSNSPTSCVTVN